MKILQDYIVPVVRLVEDGDGLRFGSLHGTAFFINSHGAFLTAAHVIRSAAEAAERRGGKVALSIRRSGEERYRFAGHIQDLSLADDPYDIAAGYIAEPSRSCFATADTSRVMLWQEVHTAGYAESAVARDQSSVRPDVRGLKGYVVRKLPAGHLLTAPHPQAFEVDFPIPHCMSGSPLVIRWRADEEPPPGAPFPLLGVCTGNEVVKVGQSTEQYGIVHDLGPLLSLETNVP